MASVAICFLNAYANPEHERQAVARLREIWPDVAVSASEELLPEFREYERLSSTVINAYLMPVMRGYLLRFQKEVQALGMAAEPVVMTSGGGVFTPELASDRPIDTLLSGPSGGISGAATSTLVLTGVQYCQAGHYRCVVSNSLGANFSSSATLTVAPTSHALPLAEALDTDDMFLWSIARRRCAPCSRARARNQGRPATESAEYVPPSPTRTFCCND